MTWVVDKKIENWKERRVNENWWRQIIYNISWTVEQRSYHLLNKFWLWNQLRTFIRLSEKYQVKYPVVICIAKADSHLWLALKSKNNIWNVWNNDRWDVKHFDTMEDWIEAMFYTLSMKSRYQKYNNTIWELSQGGRTALWLKWCKEKNTYCYATSTSSRNTNVVNCLNMLYDKSKDENFNFRF